MTITYLLIFAVGAITGAFVELVFLLGMAVSKINKKERSDDNDK